MGYYKTNRDFHEARWDEPIIMKLGNPGERGILVPKADEKVTKATGTVKTLLPKNLIRKKAPKLPEMSQMQVLRHYMRLSQETIGTDFNIDIGLGTCTMKYSPKIHEQLVRSEKLSEVHPYQDESTIQGILEIMYRDEQYIKAISGMDKVSLQPGGGTQAIFANVETIRAYHESRGEGEQRNEIITTILSHPGNPGAAATLGYKVITLYPDENGVPDIDALKAAVSEHTAALMITNPEDTGIYNEKIKEFVDIVHAVGGLCVYDQANLNGLFGITRARDAGFDMCHYNLHKSFSSPHGCQGPAAGAQCVCEKLAKFVAAPTVEFDGEKYYLDYNRPDSIGKLRKFYGVPAVLVRTDETGVTTDDICRRIVDYGFQDYFTSHHPRIIPEPFTPEPVESYSKDDIDEFVDAYRQIAEEAYTTPQVVKEAPHHAALGSRIQEDGLIEWKKFATTWRAYIKMKKDT